jgi:hypothetical protein
MELGSRDMNERTEGPTARVGRNGLLPDPTNGL